MRFSKSKAKLDGYSLIYALLLVLIISTFFSALFIVEDIELKLIQNHQEKVDVRRNIKSGVAKYLRLYNSADNTAISLFPNSSSEVVIESKCWGLERLLLVRSSKNSVKDSSVVLLASTVRDSSLGVLHLKDKGIPLAISRVSLIEGDAWLPNAGLTRPTYRGAGFEPRSRISGKINVSSKDHRIEEQFMLSRLETFEKYLRSVEISGLEIRDIDTLTHSFFRPPILLNIGDSILELENQYLEGNIIIQSKGHIKISENCSLDKVVVIGKRVTVKRGFKGSVQILAENYVVVEEDAQLRFPSTLVLKSNGNLSTKSIRVKKGAKLEASIWDLSLDENSLVIIEEEARIDGLVCSLNRIFLSGSIFGRAEVGEFVTIRSGFTQVGELSSGSIQKSSENILCTYSGMSSAKIGLWLN